MACHELGFSDSTPTFFEVPLPMQPGAYCSAAQTGIYEPDVHYSARDDSSSLSCTGGEASLASCQFSTQAAGCYSTYGSYTGGGGGGGHTNGLGFSARARAAVGLSCNGTSSLSPPAFVPASTGPFQTQHEACAVYSETTTEPNGCPNGTQPAYPFNCVADPRCTVTETVITGDWWPPWEKRFTGFRCIAVDSVINTVSFDFTGHLDDTSFTISNQLGIDGDILSQTSAGVTSDWPASVAASSATSTSTTAMSAAAKIDFTSDLVVEIRATHGDDTVSINMTGFNSVQNEFQTSEVWTYDSTSKTEDNFWYTGVSRNNDRWDCDVSEKVFAVTGYEWCCINPGKPETSTLGLFYAVEWNGKTELEGETSVKVVSTAAAIVEGIQCLGSNHTTELSKVELLITPFQVKHAGKSYGLSATSAALMGRRDISAFTASDLLTLQTTWGCENTCFAGESDSAEVGAEIVVGAKRAEAAALPPATAADARGEGQFGGKIWQSVDGARTFEFETSATFKNLAVNDDDGVFAHTGTCSDDLQWLPPGYPGPGHDCSDCNSCFEVEDLDVSLVAWRVQHPKSDTDEAFVVTLLASDASPHNASVTANANGPVTTDFAIEAYNLFGALAGANPLARRKTAKDPASATMVATLAETDCGTDCEHWEASASLSGQGLDSRSGALSAKIDASTPDQTSVALGPFATVTQAGERHSFDASLIFGKFPGAAASSTGFNVSLNGLSAGKPWHWDTGMRWDEDGRRASMSGGAALTDGATMVMTMEAMREDNAVVGGVVFDQLISANMSMAGFPFDRSDTAIGSSQLGWANPEGKDPFDLEWPTGMTVLAIPFNMSRLHAGRSYRYAAETRAVFKDNGLDAPAKVVYSDAKLQPHELTVAAQARTGTFGDDGDKVGTRGTVWSGWPGSLCIPYTHWCYPGGCGNSRRRTAARWVDG